MAPKSKILMSAATRRRASKRMSWMPPSETKSQRSSKPSHAFWKAGGWRGFAASLVAALQKKFSTRCRHLYFSRSCSAYPLVPWRSGMTASMSLARSRSRSLKSLIADQCQAIDAGHESVKAGDVVPLARQEHEADQIAERIDDHRDLRRQAAARFPDGLILSP